MELDESPKETMNKKKRRWKRKTVDAIYLRIWKELKHIKGDVESLLCAACDLQSSNGNVDTRYLLASGLTLSLITGIFLIILVLLYHTFFALECCFQRLQGTVLSSSTCNKISV